jgi:hypothetical protein
MVGEALMAVLMIGLIWVVGQWLDLTKVGSHALFENAIVGADFHYGLRVQALFDLLDFGVMLNFIFRSFKHAYHTFREDE